MGALRAAELAAFGMEGVGRIFEAFRSGELEDDDEVAVAHGPASAGWRVLSDAMVNIRRGLRLATERSIIAPQTGAALAAAAKRMFYPDRTWAAVCEEGARLGLPTAELASLRSFADRERPDQKRADARALLSHLARECRGELLPHEPAFELERTLFLDQLVVTTARPAGRDADAELSADRIRNHVRLAAPDRDRLVRKALLLHLARAEALRSGVEPPRRADAVERFRRDRGLSSPGRATEWMQRAGTAPDEAVRLAETEAVLHGVERRYAPEIDRMLPTVLKLEGRYGEIVDRVADKWRRLAQRGMSNPSLDDAGIAIEELLRWYEERWGPVTTDWDAHASELGFPSARLFLTELLAEYLDQASRQTDAMAS
jgi:hypothetical protein